MRYNTELLTDMVRLGKPFCAEDNDRLYPLVKAGDADARKQMIEGNMSLAVVKVDSFIGCVPALAHLRDDLLSAAFIGLMKAVNQMATGKARKYEGNWNPTDCIGAWINRELSELVDIEVPIYVPPRSKYRAQAKGEELKVPTVCNDIPEQYQSGLYENELEIRDLMAVCCESEEERTFMAMREAGHTLVTIAAAIGRSRMFVQRLRKKLGARIAAKIEAICNDRE